MERERPLRLACWTLLALGALDRLVVLRTFGFRFAGDDDTVQWTAAHDYAHGIFHGLHFYGQDYNPMLEALLAAPFVGLGAKPELVLPIITSLLALAPFWSFAAWNYKRAHFTAALLFLSMPVLLPPEYGLMTTMPRGFVHGIALFALLPWIDALQRPFWRSLLTGSVVALAYVINPNTLVFSAAWAVYFALRTPWRAWASALAGTLPAVVCHLLGRAAARAHPEHVLHTIYGWRLDFHPEGIPEGMGRLHAHFAWLFPVAWPFGEALFWTLPLLIGVLLVRRDRVLAGALAASFAVIVLSFAFAKVHDGYTHVIFPYSRMFLAAPLLLAWVLAEHLRRKGLHTTRYAIPLVAAGLLLTPIKIVRLPEVVRQRMQDQVDLPVQELPLERLRADAQELDGLAQRCGADAIICLRRFQRIRSQYRAYAYPLWRPQLPPTYVLGFERRYWQRERMDTMTFHTILFTDGDSTVWGPLETTGPLFVQHELREGTVRVLEHNTLRTDSLLQRLFTPAERNALR